MKHGGGSTLRVKREVNLKQSLPFVPLVKLTPAHRVFVPWAGRLRMRNLQRDVHPVVIVPPVFLVRFGRVAGFR